MSNSTYQEWDVQLINARTGNPIDDDSGIYNVLTASDPSEVTIYSDDSGTSASNPGTMTDGRITFYTASPTTTVDLTFVTATGHAVFVEALTPSQHRVEVNPEALEQTLITFYTGNVACGAVTNTGFDLPNGALVKDVFLHATDASTAGGIDVGVSTDPNGFLIAAVISATGYKNHDAPVVTNATASQNFVSATQVRGLLIASWQTGLVTATAKGDKGYFAPKKHKVVDATTGAQLVYTLTATNSGGSGKGYLYVVYDRVPTVGN